MNQGTVIVHRGYKIKSVKGGWVIEGQEGCTFTTPDMAKQHIQMCERPPVEQTVMVNGRPYEISNVTAVSLLPNGTYGLSVQYKRR